MSWWNPFSKPPTPPFKKGVYIERLIIEAMSADEPTGSATKGMLRISATKDETGKIWLDKDVAWHELQHLCAIEDDAFGRPDQNIIG
jgi:hypothetical protein